MLNTTVDHLLGLTPFVEGVRQITVAFAEWSGGFNQYSTQFDSDVDVIRGHLNSIAATQSQGITAMGTALLGAIQFIDDHSTGGTTTPLLVLLTDGSNSRRDSAAFNDAIVRLRARPEIEVAAIGIGFDADLDELTLVAGGGFVENEVPFESLIGYADNLTLASSFPCLDTPITTTDTTSGTTSQTTTPTTPAPSVCIRIPEPGCGLDIPFVEMCDPDDLDCDPSDCVGTGTVNIFCGT